MSGTLGNRSYMDYVRLGPVQQDLRRLHHHLSQRCHLCSEREDVGRLSLVFFNRVLDRIIISCGLRFSVLFIVTLSAGWIHQIVLLNLIIVLAPSFSNGAIRCTSPRLLSSRSIFPATGSGGIASRVGTTTRPPTPSANDRKTFRSQHPLHWDGLLVSRSERWSCGRTGSCSVWMVFGNSVWAMKEGWDRSRFRRLGRQS